MGGGHGTVLIWSGRVVIVIIVISGRVLKEPTFSWSSSLLLMVSGLGGVIPKWFLVAPLLVKEPY